MGFSVVNERGERPLRGFDPSAHQNDIARLYREAAMACEGVPGLVMLPHVVSEGPVFLNARLGPRVAQNSHSTLNTLATEGIRRSGVGRATGGTVWRIRVISTDNEDSCSTYADTPRSTLHCTEWVLYTGPGGRKLCRV